MYDHETRGLQIVLDAWTNIGACKVPYFVAWSCASRAYGKICRYLPADGVELRYPQYILDGLCVDSSAVSDSWRNDSTKEFERASDASGHARTNKLD